MPTKLGFYLHSFEIGEYKASLFEAIRSIQPPVLLVHAWDQVDQLRQLAPHALIIGRMDFFTGAGQPKLPVIDLVEEWLDPDRGEPEAHGRAFAEHILTDNFKAAEKTVSGRLCIDAWMSLNEVVPGPNSAQFQQNPERLGRRLRAYDAFQVGFRDRLATAGIEAVAFNFGAGNFSTAQHYLDFFPRTLASYTYLGFHEYGWPALSWELDPTAVSSAGTYRPIVTGIRQVTGRDYQVVLTEAGLTFMHKYPQSGHDEGWLFVPPREYGLEPLSQKQYWRSLAWLNSTLMQDDFVRGACLYEVGHHGDWATFRHFGRDNDGQRIWIVDEIGRLAAADGTRSVGPTAVPAQPAPAVSLHGRVVSAAGAPVGGALIRLVGDEQTLGGDPHAVANSRGSVTWTRALTGYSGSLWNCWQRFVAPNTAGITWEEFRHEMAQYNPALGSSDGRLLAEQTYYLPENRVHRDTRDSAPPVVWDRLLSGFDGDLWTCWRLHVQGKVLGLTWQQFQRAMTAYNPGLAASNSRLLAEQTYVLPRSARQVEYARVAYSRFDGSFAFEDLRPGPYRIEVAASGFEPFVQTVDVTDQTHVTLTLEMISVALVRGDSFVSCSGRHFVVDGRTFRFVGVNLRGLAHYGLSDPVRGADAAQQLQAARDMGARVVRIFLPHCRVSIEDTRLRLINLLKLLEARFPDMYLIVALANLYSDVDFRVPGDDHYYTHRPVGEGRDLLNVDWFRGGYRDSYLPLVQKIVQDEFIRNSPRILAYNIGNELKAEARAGDHNVGHPELLVQFMHSVAQQIYRWDGGRHLITTGMISTRHAHMEHRHDLRRQLYGLPELAFITNHTYHDDDDPATDQDQQNAAPSREDDSDLADALGKPLLIEEAGMITTPNRRDRSPWVQSELQVQLDGRRASGYMPWGFMAGHDNGDGDRQLGLDHLWHEPDWHALRSLLGVRAGQLEGDSAPVPPPSGAFTVGQQVFTQTTVFLRSDASRQAAIVDKVPARTRVAIAGSARKNDSLQWWPVRVSGKEGWMAQHDPSGQTLLSAV